MRIFLVVTLATLTGCGLATHVRPVPPRTLAVEASAGGPATPIPLPLSTVGASYGVVERVDVHAHVHLTTLAFGIAGFDVGGTWMPLSQRGAVPALALTGRAYAFTNFTNGTLTYADLTATASYLLGGRFLSYLTLTGMVAFLDGQFLWSPGLGEQFQFGRFGLQIELRWYDPTYVSQYSPVPWISAAGLGAFGLVIGASYRFGGGEAGARL